jgi:hypothetical protein
MMRLRWVLAIGLAPWWSSCTATTHADDYEVLVPPKDERLCARCPGRPDLRHVPCPPDSADDSPHEVVVFAMRTLELGTNASTWSTGYNVGLDQDCSSRPGGKPIQCAPRNPLSVFERLAGGVDNALATQVFYPLIQLEGTNPQSLINDSLEHGIGGVLLIVDSWNGLSDDEQVTVRLVPALTTVGGPPAWDGTDRWIAYADRYDPALPGMKVPDTDIKTSTAYVTGGALVWDARSLLTFRLPFGAGGAVVDMGLADVVVTGRIMDAAAPRLLTDSVLSGVWSSFLASRLGVQLAEMITQCDLCETKRVTPVIENLIYEAPDMLLPSSKGAAACDAISVGFLGSYVETAGVEKLQATSTLPKSCAGAEPCTQ